MKNIKDGSATQTILTISMGLLIIFFISDLQWPLIGSLIIGITGLVSNYLANKIHYIWMKLTYLLSLVVPKIILILIFYLFLFPLAILSKIFRKKGTLILKNNLPSTFITTNKTFSKESFEKQW